MSRRLGAAIVSLLLVAAAASCGALTAVTGGGPTFADALQRFRDAVREQGGRVGVVVVDSGSGTMLLSCAADEGFVPASNTKLLTAAVALRTLGPSATLTTELLHTGDVRGGELHGDLVLRGHGDPTLGTSALPVFVQAVQALGVRRVAGRVRGDGSWLGDEHLGVGWEWNDLEQDYAAPFGGLCWDGNVRPVVDADGAERHAAMSDPTTAAASALVVALQQAGVEVVAADVAAGPDEHRIELVHSAPVAALLRPLLRQSDNLFAEQLWRVAAKVATGDGGSASAVQHGRGVLAALGVDDEGLVLVDGSGLSRQNLLRPAQVVAALGAMLDSPQCSVWLDALPVGGHGGTLRERFVDGPAKARVLAKTGTLTRVTALSGYLLQPQDPPLVFCILWNDFLGDDASARRTVDAFVQDLAAAVGW